MTSVKYKTKYIDNAVDYWFSFAMACDCEPVMKKWDTDLGLYSCNFWKC